MPNAKRSEVRFMPTFKFVINHGKNAYQTEKDQKDCPVVGKKIGEIIDGGFLGLEGYELQITGGSDKDGFSMRKDVEGIMRKKIILIKGAGFSGKLRRKKKRFAIKGVRKRKMVRGNLISSDIAQINCKVTKTGVKPLEEIFQRAVKKEGEAK